MTRRHGVGSDTSHLLPISDPIHLPSRRVLPDSTRTPRLQHIILPANLRPKGYPPFSTIDATTCDYALLRSAISRVRDLSRVGVLSRVPYPLEFAMDGRAIIVKGRARGVDTIYTYSTVASSRSRVGDLLRRRLPIAARGRDYVTLKLTKRGIARVDTGYRWPSRIVEVSDCGIFDDSRLLETFVR